MATIGRNTNAANEPGFFELVTHCQVGELAKRVGKAVVDVFVLIFVGIYETLAWTCHSIYSCITCKCCELEEVEPAPRLEQRVGQIGRERLPNPVPAPRIPIAPPETLLPPLIHRHVNQRPLQRPEMPPLLPVKNPTAVVVPEKPFHKRVGELVLGPISTEELSERLKLLDPDSLEGRVYKEAIDWRVADDAAMTSPPNKPNPAPVLPVDDDRVPSPAHDIDDDEDIVEPAPIPNLPLKPQLPKQPVAVAGLPALLIEGEKQANRDNALARVQEFAAALETTLAELNLDREQALQDLAEIETGTPKGTLRTAPPEVLDRLKATPLRVKENIFSDKMVPNPDRAEIWPAGTRAADRLVDLEKSPDAALLRLAEIRTFERLFHVRPSILEFDLDVVLEKYSKKHPTRDLEEWYDYACAGEAMPPDRGEYFDALDAYRLEQNIHGQIGAKAMLSPTEESVPSEQGRLIAEYLSNIHDIFTARRAALTIGSTEEATFKGQIRAFIAVVNNANGNCVDQMISQLEDRILDLLSEESPADEKTPQDGFKFKAGLALTQYRATMIRAFTRQLYPDEKHMADLEREVKQKLAENLNLKGRIFLAGAKYQGASGNESVKAETINAAVLNEHNPLVFLLDHFRDDNHESCPMKSLRNGASNWIMNKLFEVAELNEETDPLIQALSAQQADYLRASDGGPLTFGGVLLYLENAGILIQN